jgi:glutaredoxin
MMELYCDYVCPYCIRVFRFLEGKQHGIIFKDIRKNPEYRTELRRVNDNITQVPCLVVDGAPMLESDDIINFLKGVLP